MSPVTDHLPSKALRTRGTVVVVPGRGETTATYARLGARLAADAYRVRVLDAPDLEAADSDALLANLVVELEHAASSPGIDADTSRPLVIVGADSGAAAVGALLAQDRFTSSGWPDAVVLAGLPGYAVSAAGTWDAQLDERTSCPVHRTVLSQDRGRAAGALEAPVPQALLDAAYDLATEVPTLVLIGDADPLADRTALAKAVARLPRARLSVVHDAHHDVLNDVQHRSVAAEIVSFLEALRNELVPLVKVETSAW